MFSLWYNKIDSILDPRRRKENFMFEIVIIVLLVLVLAFQVISRSRKNRFSQQKVQAQHFYMQITSRWKKNAFVISDESITCTIPFGKLTVVYPPFNTEVEEGECTEEVFVELINQFVEHGFPVDVSGGKTKYFIAHMPQKKSAT